MKLEKTKNAYRNISIGLVGKLITIVVPFIIRTIMIKTLGAEYLGIDSLFSSILQVLNITELGVSSAIVYSMYKPIAEDDTKTICALLNYYKKIYKYIGLFILVMGTCLIPFLPNLINQDPTVGGGIPAQLNIYIIYIIYLMNAVIGYLLFAYKTALPTAFQRVDKVTIVNTLTSLLSSVLQIIILILYRFSNATAANVFYIYMAVLPIGTILNNLIISRMVDKNYPQYRCEGTISKELRFSIREKISGLVINKVCVTTRNSFDSIFISAFLGLTITTIYNNYYYVIKSLIILIGVIASSILAGVGNSMAISTTEKNYNDFRNINFLYMWLSGWCTICLLALYQPFMKLWVGEDLMFPFSVVVCLCVYFYALKMGDVRAVYSDAAGLWWENKGRAICEAVVNLILNFILGKLWGIYGIILATLISLFVINFCFGSQIVFKHYFKNHKLGEYFKDQALYFIVNLITALLTLETINFVIGKLNLGILFSGSNSPLLVLIIASLICIILPNILLLLFYYNSKIFKESFKWLFNRNSRGRKILKILRLI